MAKKEPKSLFRRLTRLFRSGPVVKRKIRALDTSIAVADKTKSSGTLLFQKSLSPTYATITSNAYNLSERLMRYQDFQEMEYCVSFQTLVPTPDGMVQIGELADQCAKDPEKTFVVYAYDHEQKRIVPAFGKQARQTRIDHAWKVTFDNGKTITGSDNHRLMLRDGSYREIRDLRPGDAMMPFYRKDLFAGAQEGTKGYNWVYTMDDRFKGWTKEHQLIAEWVAGRQLADDECVHHINFVKTDNRPENLKIMTQSDHNSYHASINNGVKWAPENHEWINNFKRQHAKWMRDHAPTARKDVTFARILELSECLDFDFISVSRALDVDKNVLYSRLADHGFASYDSFVQAYRQGDELIKGDRSLCVAELSMDSILAQIKENDTKQSLCIRLGCTVNVFNKFLDRKVNKSWLQIREELGWRSGVDRAGGRPKGTNNRPLTFQQVCDAYEPGMTLPRLVEALPTNTNKNTVLSRLAQNGFQKFSAFQDAYANCKVVSVEYVGVMPLYDLTVDGYKNFATDSVISHNTPEIAAALDIYADETVAADEKGRCLHIYSDNEKIKELLEDLFYNIINVEFNMRPWARNLPVRQDSVIPLLDGRSITIRQLAEEHAAGRQNWVYSVQDETHRMVPGRVAWCGLTRKDSELVRVWLDDGTYVDCTPDHEWVLRNGTNKRADLLTNGDSLMPLYRQAAMMGGKKGYERVYDSESQQHLYTHRLMVQHRWSKKDVGSVVHHVNFDRSDNTPTNLRVMTANDHIELHRKLASSYNFSPKHKLDNKQRSTAMKAMWSDPERRNAAKSNMVVKFDARCVDLVVEALATQEKYVSPKALGDRLKSDKAFMDHFRSINPGTKRDLTKALNSHAGFANLLRKVGIDSYINLVRQRLPSIASTAWFQRAEKKSQKMSGVVPVMRAPKPTYKNHKVDHVERLSERDDVYCMEVLGPNGEHDRHRFGIMCYGRDGQLSKSSIISANCKYGDFFLYNDVSPEYGVVNAFPIPVNEIEREENYDRDDPFAVRYRWVTLGNRTLENWEVTHFRLLGNDMFLPYGSSIIEPARRIWRQLILIEDAMLVYRVVRAPERRVFYIDVANIPPQDVPAYVENQKQNLRNAPVADRTTGRVDLRYNPMPVHWSTPVPLLDGRTLTIKQVSEELEAGKQPWVYSVQDDTHRMVPGKVTWCGKNYQAKRLVKVWLDDGSYVLTAPEHPFVMRDGSQRRADALSTGDSLMPLYRRVSEKGYESCYDPATQVYVPTHQLVASSVYPDEWATTEARTVHHKRPWEPNNKLDNSPDNLQVMSIWDHRKWHVDRLEHTLLRPDVIATNAARLSAWNKTDDKKRRVSACNLKRNSVTAMAGYNGSDLHQEHNVQRSIAMTSMWSDEARRQSAQTNMRYVMTDAMFARLAEIVREQPKAGRTKVHAAIMADPVFVEGLCGQSLGRDVARYSTAAWEGELRRRGFDGLSGFRKQLVGRKNHKVDRVEIVDVDGEDVYCMTVMGPRGEDDRHDFAVCGLSGPAGSVVHNDGIIVKNSVEEDYFVPVRGNESGTKIDTLQGGQNTAAVEDVAYIQKKLFAALKIPRAYLGYDEMLSSKATLAQEDIRFSRTINVIQKTMMAELNKLAIIHLYAHGFDGEDLQNFVLRLSNPSTVAQQQKLELWRAKFEIAGSAPEGMGSKLFVRKEIWGLNEEQCKQIDDQRLKEKKIDALIDAVGNPAGAGGPEGDAAGGGGMEDLFGTDSGAGGEAPAAGAEGGTPPEENASVKPEEEEDGPRGLLTGGDDPDDDETYALRLKDIQDKPVTVKSQLDRVLYNRGRHRTHGASKTHMPDFTAMTSGRGREMEDPYGSDWIKSMVTNPFAESTNVPARRLRLPADISSTLNKMSLALKMTRSGDILAEGRDVQDEIDQGTDEDLDIELSEISTTGTEYDED